MQLHVTKAEQTGQPGILHKKQQLQRQKLHRELVLSMPCLVRRNTGRLLGPKKDRHLEVDATCWSSPRVLDASYTLGPEGRATMFGQVKFPAPISRGLLSLFRNQFPQMPWKQRMTWHPLPAAS